ncbi:hypothetical protein [Rhizobium leguminosarum]
MAKSPPKAPVKPAAKPAAPKPQPAAKAPPAAKKQSSPALSTLASNILSGKKKATQDDAARLAASVLGQDEKKGQK